MKNDLINKALLLIRKWRSIIIFLITCSYFIISYNYPFYLKNIYVNSITCLSILFGFNMIVVTQYYSNVNLNLFLKKAGQFSKFKEKYRFMLICLVFSLIIIYTLSIFEEMDFLILHKNLISNSIVISLSLLNLFKSVEIVEEFFNVYGTTYSNTFRNIDFNEDENDVHN